MSWKNWKEVVGSCSKKSVNELVNIKSESQSKMSSHWLNIVECSCFSPLPPCALRKNVVTCLLCFGTGESALSPVIWWLEITIKPEPARTIEALTTSSAAASARGSFLSSVWTQQWAPHISACRGGSSPPSRHEGPLSNMSRIESGTDISCYLRGDAAGQTYKLLSLMYTVSSFIVSLNQLFPSDWNGNL